MAVKSGNITVRAGTAGERRTGDGQTIVFNGVEDAQAGIGTVSGQQNDFDPLGIQLAIEVQQFLDQAESAAGLKRLAFVGYLILLICFQSLLFINPVTLIEIEQGTDIVDAKAQTKDVKEAQKDVHKQKAEVKVVDEMVKESKEKAEKVLLSSRA